MCRVYRGEFWVKFLNYVLLSLKILSIRQFTLCCHTFHRAAKLLTHCKNNCNDILKKISKHLEYLKYTNRYLGKNSYMYHIISSLCQICFKTVFNGLDLHRCSWNFLWPTPQSPTSSSTALTILNDVIIITVYIIYLQTHCSLMFSQKRYNILQYFSC